MSILLYGMEEWTLRISTMNTIETFEMWIFCKILKIKWTSRITNNEVLRRLNKDREMLSAIKKRKTAYLGHIARKHKVSAITVYY